MRGCLPAVRRESKLARDMRDPGDVVSGGLPRPGRALKGVLIALATSAIVGAIVVNWAPGGRTGEELFQWLAFAPNHPERAWSWLTSGLLTSPGSFSHALWSLVGLYFLTTDLEKRWGAARLLRFLGLSVLFGNLAVFLVTLIPLGHAMFHPPIVFGPMAAISATAMAWSKDNANRSVRLFFFLPVNGKALAWITLGFAVLSPLFGQGAPEGAAAPFGGILAGALFGGTPSPLRSVWLRLRLSILRRRGPSIAGLSLSDLESSVSNRPRSTKRTTKGGPSLRILQGGQA